MKETAMQEYIKELEGMLKLCDKTPLTPSEILKICISDAKLKLPKEKEQIVQAVYDAMGLNFDPNRGRAEMYFRENFKED